MRRPSLFAPSCKEEFYGCLFLPELLSLHCGTSKMFL